MICTCKITLGRLRPADKISLLGLDLSCLVHAPTLCYAWHECPCTDIQKLCEPRRVDLLVKPMPNNRSKPSLVPGGRRRGVAVQLGSHSGLRVADVWSLDGAYIDYVNYRVPDAWVAKFVATWICAMSFVQVLARLFHPTYCFFSRCSIYSLPSLVLQICRTRCPG